jgi:hypothetical protein
MILISLFFCFQKRKGIDTLFQKNVQLMIARLLLNIHF